jgi:hypothetical protein
MENQKNDIQLRMVEKIIEERFNFLEKDFGYVPKLIVQTEPPFIEQIKIEYSNEIKKRNIIIGCSKGNVFNEVKYTFTVSIIRLPYSSIEDYFSLNVFLNSVGLNFETSLDNIFTQENASIIVAKLSDTLRDYAIEIIDGVQWLDNYYPRKD